MRMNNPLVPAPPVKLRAGWLSGLRSYEVQIAGKLVGHVLRESMGRRWAVFYLGDDEYDDLLYDFDTRTQALKSLVKRHAEETQQRDTAK